MNKTKIVPLEKGLLFLKGKYYLLESGKVSRRPRKGSALRMRRKPRKFKARVEAGKMDYADIRTAYRSWRGGCMKRFHAFYIIRGVDALYNECYLYTTGDKLMVYLAKKGDVGGTPHRPRGHESD